MGLDLKASFLKAAPPGTCSGGCWHVYVDMGFQHSKLVCRHCDKTKEEIERPKPADPEVTVLPPRPSFQKLPILRGFNEVSALFHLAAKFDAVIAGGYGRYCASPRKDRPEGPSSSEEGTEKESDVDVFPSTSDGCSSLVSALIERKFFVMMDTPYSVTLGHPNFQCGMPFELARWYNVPTPVQIVRPDHLGNKGWRGIGKWRTHEDLAEEVLSTFDMPICRAAIVGPEEVVADVRFWKEESDAFVNIEGFRNLSFLYSRLSKYRARGYKADIGRIFALYKDHAAKVHDLDKQQEVENMLKRIDRDPKKVYANAKRALAQGRTCHPADSGGYIDAGKTRAMNEDEIDKAISDF